VTGIRDALDGHRLIVCVGTGGVGKTTISAAIALGAARRGRRAIVLTIDPARALARAFGLPSLAPGGEPVHDAAGIELHGRLEAGMLDAKLSWDDFVRRHAPNDEIARTVLENRFYQQLSTSFAGSTEYMAIEEMCRLAESGRHDLIVLDTPPSAHALDFLRAPERLDPVLDPRVASLLTSSTEIAGAFARFVVAQLERAAGGETLREITGFFVALAAFLDRALARTRSARALLRDPGTGFVLVAGPRQLVLEQTALLAERMRALDTPLAALVLNRVHPPPRTPPAEIDRALAAVADPAVRAWLRATWDDAVAEAAAEGASIAGLPADVPRAEIPEGGRDVHSLADLAAIAERLWA
jgi:anion-transporting  ArsA/GET3 family ATPase